MTFDQPNRKEPLPTDTRVFTIVSKNYLHYAINLMAGVTKYLPDAQRSVILCDRLDGLDVKNLPFEVIEVESLPIPHIDRMIYYYSILELNTAIKPFAFTYLLGRKDSTKIIYFDPDINIYSDITPLSELLDYRDIVLTPHLTDFLGEDDRHPSDLSILQSGTYNLGFLALKRSASATHLLSWWQNKLLRDCVVDIPNGLFTDQKWIDLIPGIFPNIEIVRNPGWNVAYWNIKHRHIELNKDGHFTVNGEPLVFFHFSGYVTGEKSISKHQNRFTFDDLPSAVALLFGDYDKAIAEAGRHLFKDLPYAFRYLPSGIPIPEIGRRLLRTELELNQALPDLRSPAGEQLIINLFNQPIDDLNPPITRLAWCVYEQRGDLHLAFPDATGVHRPAFSAWLKETAAQEEGIDETFILPLRKAHFNTSNTSSSDLENTLADFQHRPDVVSGAISRPTLRLAQSIYWLAWRNRNLARPIFRPELRARIRNRLLTWAYSSRTATPHPPITPAIKPINKTPGINLIGYVRAESGVGESARSTLRALTAQRIPHSIIDFRVGNISRMEENVEERREKGFIYPINLFHINADQIPVVQNTLAESLLDHTYKIGYWAWELPNFPDCWQSAFSQLDEVWVPSTFCQNAISSKSPIPVICIPHSIELGRTSLPNRKKFGLTTGSFVFFTMADMLSIPERKNPLGAVSAFIKAFSNSGLDVELVVKISNAEMRPDIIQQILWHAEQNRNIRIIDSYLNREDLNSLMDTCDCFVSLHRSEGFGLGIAEAMSQGKPVITTGWSGNMDFTSTNNSLLVDYDLVELDRDYGPYKKGEIWANPHIDHAAFHMKTVATQPGLRRAISERARKDCRTLLAPEVIGRKIQQRLALICSRA